MDLKKYFDCLGENEEMDVTLLRVRIENRGNYCKKFVL
jgi:hypothetical protein